MNPGRCCRAAVALVSAVPLSLRSPSCALRPLLQLQSLLCAARPPLPLRSLSHAVRPPSSRRRGRESTGRSLTTRLQGAQRGSRRAGRPRAERGSRGRRGAGIRRRTGRARDAGRRRGTGRQGQGARRAECRRGTGRRRGTGHRRGTRRRRSAGNRRGKRGQHHPVALLERRVARAAPGADPPRRIDAVPVTD